MGSPGAGKTSIGRILGGQLGRKAIDVDDDVLENVWGMTVAEKVIIVHFFFTMEQLHVQTGCTVCSKILPCWGRRGRGSEEGQGSKVRHT